MRVAEGCGGVYSCVVMYGVFARLAPYSVGGDAATPAAVSSGEKGSDDLQASVLRRGELGIGTYCTE